MQRWIDGTARVIGPFVVIAAAVLSGPAAADETEYDVVTQGTRKVVRPDGSDGIKMLVEAANLGSGEIEIAELTFQPNNRGRSHVHGSTEIFYVLSGQLTHVVNGKGARLTPGMVGIVRSGDTVEHIIEVDEPTRVLIIWVPGGEAGRIFGERQLEEIPPLEIIDFGGGEGQD